MTECLHPRTERIIDKLGLMTEKPDGSVSAPVLAWSIRCRECFVVLSSHDEPYGRLMVPEPEAEQVIVR